MIIISTPNGEMKDEDGNVLKFENRNRAVAYLYKVAGYSIASLEENGIKLIYTNERRECKCCECEQKADCYIKDKFQRLPKEKTNGLGLGLCPKLQ